MSNRHCNGVDSKDNKDEGAGDQGIMFGYACRETGIDACTSCFSKILRLMAEDRKNELFERIEPDQKVKLQCCMKMINLPKLLLLSFLLNTQKI